MEAMLKEANIAVPIQQPVHETTPQSSKGGQAITVPSEYGNDGDNPNHFPPSPSHTLQWTPNETINQNDGDFRRTSYASIAGDTYGRRNGGSPNTSGAPNEPVFQDSLTPSMDGIQTSSATPYAGLNEEEDGISGKSAMDKGVSSIAPPQNSHWEYHGPGSFLSICSKPGMDWVANKTGVSDFVEVAKTFNRDISRHLKLGENISSERAPEPDRETAWRYCQTYFDKTPEGAFDIVNRPSFEARLQAHFERGGEQVFNGEDAAWYALRNTVYAFGCRFELGKASYSTTFKEAQVGGWAYFENAMSRHTELIFCRSGIMAVQALVVMVRLK
jgi:hypothetical protein